MRSLYLFCLTTFLVWSSLHATETVYIKGRVVYSKEKSLNPKDSITVTSFDPSVSIYKSNVDQKGNFQLSFPKGFTGDVDLKYGSSTSIQLIVSPGDHQYIVVQPIAEGISVVFSGDNALINQEITDYIAARSDAWMINGKKQKRFDMINGGLFDLLELPETFQRKKAFLKSYIESKECSSLFMQWAWADVSYNYASRLFHIKTNQHQPIADHAFYKEFPINDSKSLLSYNYLNYLYRLRSSAIYGSPQINTIVVYPDTIKKTSVYNNLNRKNRQVFDLMLKYSNLSDSAIIENLKYPDSVTKYTRSKEDRFTMNFINQRTTGIVRDYYIANYILDELKRSSPWAPIEYRYPMLIQAYKKSTGKGTYLKILKKVWKKSHG